MYTVPTSRALFGIDTWFYKLLYSFMQGIFNITDTVYKIVLTLCGMKKESTSGNSLLESLIKDSTIQMIFKWICILGICVLGIVICIGVIRAILSRKLDDPVKSQKGIATRTISSIILMVLIPVFFFTFISLVGDITQYIINSMHISPDTGQVMDTAYNNSIAQEIFQTAQNQTLKPYTELPADVFASKYDISPNGVNYIIGIFGGAIILVAMFMMGFKLAERIFMLIFYFLISPIILAISPLDDGNRFNIWKDSVIAKLLASGGIIVCINLYLISMPVVKKFSFLLFSDNPFIAQVFNLLFLIAGAFFASRGGEMIANLVGDNIGANEGRETADSLRKASAGLRVGTATIASGLALGKSALFGSKNSRELGIANSLGDKINSNASIDNSSKASKNSKFSSIGAFCKDNTQNFRRFGVIGGSVHNVKNGISNIAQARRNKKSDSSDDTKATKQ